MPVVIAYFLIYVVWGSTYFFIGQCLHDIPPFMLGLSWNSTERMSSQQADIMTSEIAAHRRSLEPVVRKICSLWLRMHGYSCPFELEWEAVNLQDKVELARAALYAAQAKKALAEAGAEGDAEK